MFRNNAFVTPPVVKNLIIINVLFYMAQTVLPGNIGNWMIANLALFYPESPFFGLHQLITYMFLHGSMTHLFFNMYALWMFGRTLEYDLGSKRFLTYYMITGIGAALIQLGVNWIEFTAFGADQWAINRPTLGASGAVYGVLLAFGMMRPNSIIMLMLPPMPIKAKYFVMGYAALELFLGITSPGGQIAHFAHLGGMIFGYFLLKYWRNKYRY